jgi:hypothetical protein
VSVAAFAGEVEQLQARVKLLSANPSAAQGIAEALPEKWVVGEQRAEVSARGLRDLAAEYAREPARRRALRIALEDQTEELAALAALLSASPEFPGSSQRARARLAEILARRDFQSGMKNSALELWKLRAVRWLARLLAKLLRIPALQGMGGRGLVWMLVAALACLVAVWLLRFFRRHEIEAPLVNPRLVSGLTWRDWFCEGMEAAQAGRHREAVHGLYWAAVYRLEELNVWSLDRARTPREYLRIAAGRGVANPQAASPRRVTPEQRAALEALTRAFELTWYGYRQAGQEDFQTALAQIEVLGCRL